MFKFKELGKPSDISISDWNNWLWQLRNFKKFPSSTKSSFLEGAVPYYVRLASTYKELKPILERGLLEEETGIQSMPDPLGEKKHSPLSRLVHRYPDRVLFLVTDQCAVYCRYCTRKRFTGKKQALARKKEQDQVFDYINLNPGIREVILSGGDPLTLSDAVLDRILFRLRKIPHVEIIRIASRLPTACPMRLTSSLCSILKKYQPVFLMLHFNHPLELTQEAQTGLSLVADSGILMFNQTVLLKGFNNHPSILQALMRRLLYLRVKPYYMFQCDPSEGTDHFRTSVENSRSIQKELWGRLSGLALPNFSLDIPGGGGKVPLVPDFVVQKTSSQWQFKGWDGFHGIYKNPKKISTLKEIPPYFEEYQKEWEVLKNQIYGKKF